MFSTFDASLNTQSTETTPRGPRQARRQQVGLRQACENCRINRIKCNDEKPCRSCQKRGARCHTSNSGGSTKESRSNRAADVPKSISPSSLSAEKETISRQNKELHDLRKRLAEFEQRTEEQNTVTQSSGNADLSLATIEPRPRRRQCEGVWTVDPVTNQTLYYGPSSSFYFIDRMSTYLRESIPGLGLDEIRELHTPVKSPSALLSGGYSIAEEDRMTIETLSKTQEESYLNLFWQSYHYTCPILHITEFREYYASLWPSSHGISMHLPHTRQPSAIVDIVLALCMQYGSAFLPEANIEAGHDDCEAAPTGWLLYERCQKLLAALAPGPSITTVQCQIYSVLYLRNASHQILANNMLASTIQTAQVLGLHLEPPSNLTQAEANIRKRIWWTLFILDNDVSIKMGRPSQICTSHTTCGLPNEVQDEEAMISFYASTNTEVSWLTYHTQSIKLHLMVRSLHAQFYMKCAEEITSKNGKSLYEDRGILEGCAIYLLRSMKAIQDWVNQVPDSLKILRKGGGESFSTTRSAVIFDPEAPFWLQRQAILLELQYHSLLMYFYRPFINFPPRSNPDTPLTIRHNISCLNHATTITNLLHQTLSEMDILNGAHQAYDYEWDATISILGFALSHPICPRNPSARKALQTSIAVLEMVGAYSQSSVGRACTVVRNFLDKIDIVSKNLHGVVSVPSLQRQSPQDVDQIQIQQDTIQSQSPLTPLSTLLDNQMSATMHIRKSKNQPQSTQVYDGTYMDGLDSMQTITGCSSMFETDDTNLRQNYETILGLEPGTDPWSVDWTSVS